MTMTTTKKARVFVDTPEERIEIVVAYSGDFAELVKELMRAGVFVPHDSEDEDPKYQDYLERAKCWYPPSAIYKVSNEEKRRERILGIISPHGEAGEGIEPSTSGL